MVGDLPFACQSPGIGIVVATKSGVGPGRHTDGYGATYMPTKAPTSELAMVQNKERKSRFKEQNLKAIQNQRDMRKYVNSIIFYFSLTFIGKKYLICLTTI